MEGSKFFSVMVVGDNPEELMAKYDLNLQVEPYVKYKYLDAEKLQNNAIKVMKQIVDKSELFNLNKFQLDAFQSQLTKLSNLSSFEYYQVLTQGLYYDDEGNALTTENPNGKWRTYRLGKNFVVPLKLKDGTESNQTQNKDVDWEKMHNANQQTYRIVWRMIKEGLEPSNEEEETIFNNMKDQENYFNTFKDEDDYVTYNTAYWNYAYLDENGWHDLDDEGKQMDWIASFYDKFVEKLGEDAQITIYECSRQ